MGEYRSGLNKLPLGKGETTGRERVGEKKLGENPKVIAPLVERPKFETVKGKKAGDQCVTKRQGRSA